MTLRIALFRFSPAERRVPAPVAVGLAPVPKPAQRRGVPALPAALSGARQSRISFREARK